MSNTPIDDLIIQAINDAETSLTERCNMAWNGRGHLGDARDVSRTVWGVFKRLRDDLGLPPYQRSPLMEGEAAFDSQPVGAGYVDGLEAAAKIADQHRARIPDHNPDDKRDHLTQGYGNAALNIACAIRAQSAAPSPAVKVDDETISKVAEIIANGINLDLPNSVIARAALEAIGVEHE